MTTQIVTLNVQRIIIHSIRIEKIPIKIASAILFLPFVWYNITADIKSTIIERRYHIVYIIYT